MGLHFADKARVPLNPRTTHTQSIMSKLSQENKLIYSTHTVSIIYIIELYAVRAYLQAFRVYSIHNLHNLHNCDIDKLINMILRIQSIT